MLLFLQENCVDYIDENTCRSCSAEYPYLDEDSNCGKHPLNPWCATYLFTGETLTRDKAPECDVCEEGYYRDDSGLCRVLEERIANCKYYNGKSICRACVEGFYLDSDGKRCLSNPGYDRNCNLFDYGTECAVCEFGYYLKEGKCVACNLAIDGCAFCDPSFPSKCLMCNFGYTHNGSSCDKTKPEEEDVEYVKKFTYDLNEIEPAAGIKNEGVTTISTLIVFLMGLVSFL